MSEYLGSDSAKTRSKMTQKYTQWGLGVEEAWCRVLAGPTGHLGKPRLASGCCFLSH